MLRIEPHGIPELIPYRDWIIWGWTGWKGTKTKALLDGECWKCGKCLAVGEDVYVSISTPRMHWLCQHPDNPPDRHMGQWLAIAGSSRKDARYMEVNVDNLQFAFLIGKEYRRGEDFPVSIEGEFITEFTSESEKEKAKSAGLVYLKSLIDKDSGVAHA
jgi:hypothetical protein